LIILESYSLYMTGKGTFYSLHPFTKLRGVLAIANLVFLGPGGPEKIILIGLLVFLIALWAGLLLPSLKDTINLLFPLEATLLDKALMAFWILLVMLEDGPAIGMTKINQYFTKKILVVPS